MIHKSASLSDDVIQMNDNRLLQSKNSCHPLRTDISCKFRLHMDMKKPPWDEMALIWQMHLQVEY